MRAVLRHGFTGIAALAYSQMAYAQGVPVSQEGAANRVEDIVVTARRTEEAQQATPVAVSAFSSAFLESQNVQQVPKIADFTPNLVINEQPGSTTAASIFIRGIGQSEPNSVAEAGVGLYLDGVYIARTGGAVFDLVDLERVEVLRGPQGTLFGRNSVGGAVQMISKRPTDDANATFKAGYASFGQWFARASVNTGLIGSTPFKATVALMHREGNGYVNNTLTPRDKDPGALNSDAIWASVRGDFSDITADYTFDYNNRKGTAPFFQIVAARPDFINFYSRSPTLGGAPFQISPDRIGRGQQAGFNDNDGNLRFDSRSETYGHALTLNWDLTDNLAVKSITAYRKFSRDAILALSGNGVLKGVVFDPASPTLTSVRNVPLFTGYTNPMKARQFTQELQASGELGDLRYIVGTFYFHEKSDEAFRQALTLVTSPAGLPAFGFPAAVATAVQSLNPGLDLLGINAAPTQAFGGSAESVAAFGQLSWKPASLDDRFELTGGLRYTHDKKSIELRGDVKPSVSGKKTYNNLSWLVSASYKISDAAMVYGRASTGYKAGGFNPRSKVINPFDPEKALAFELGLKADWLDRRLRTNLALYYTRYTDLQTNQFVAGSGGAVSQVVNAGKANIKGVELEVVAVPIDGLSIDAAVGYTDGNFKEFLYRDPASNAIINLADEAVFSNVPNTNVHVGGQYTIGNIGFGRLMARVDYAYRGKINFHSLARLSPFNKSIASPAQSTLSARISMSEIKLGNARAEISVWGENLTQNDDIVFGIDFGALGFGGAQYRKPRSFGVDMKLEF